MNHYSLYLLEILNNLVEQKTIDYVQYLDVDPTNPVEMSIVNELALIDLYKNYSQ